MSDSLIRPPVLDRVGNALVSFRRGPEHTPPDDAPLPLALAALWHGGRVLLVFDRHRRCWELPGGLIEAGETPRRAAVRELREESGQVPDAPPRFAGWAGFVLAADGRAEYGALFACRVRRPRPFRPNEEIAAARWWDPDTRPPSPGSPPDLHLAALTRPRTPDPPPRQPDAHR